MRARLTPADDRALTGLLHEVRRLLAGDLLAVRLFGSRARGEGNEDSDLDVAFVVTPAGRERRYAIYDAAYDIGLRHGVSLAPFVITEELLKRLRARGRRIALDLDREGIPL